MRKLKHVVTLGQLRERLNELLISGDSPVMVTKDGVQLGFFLPVKVWRTQEDSALSRHLVELVLTHAGQTAQSVQACIDASGGRRKQRLPKRYQWSLSGDGGSSAEREGPLIETSQWESFAYTRDCGGGVGK